METETVLTQKTVIKPFNYQLECLDAIEKAEELGQKHVLVVMASGLGKTIVAAFETKRRLSSNDTLRCLFLCHQNNILEQAQRKFKQILGPHIKYGFLHGEEKSYDSQILFASFQTITLNLDKFEPEDFDFIIVDETHHVMADTYKTVIDYFKPEFVLGVTATPERGDKQDIREIYGEEVYCLTLPTAMARGLLCPVEYKLMTDEISLQKVIETPENGKFTIGSLNRLIFIPKRDEEIARIIQEEMTKVENPRVLIFCSSISHAENMAELISGAVPIHSRVGALEKKVRLELFRQGAFPVAITVDMFNEALDVPETNFVIFLRTTDSPTIYFQQLGRGLRQHFSKSKVIILDFVANCERIQTIYDLWKETKEQSDLFPTENLWTGGPRPEPFMLDINTVDFQEKIIPIIELMNQLLIDFYSTWQEASEASISLGIKTRLEYVNDKKYKEDPRLPSSPNYIYKDFPGWAKFLEKERGVGVEKYSTWQEASEAIKILEIHDSMDYRGKFQKDFKLPAGPESFYSDFPGWAKFLGKERGKGVEKYATWQEASEAAMKLGIHVQSEYRNKFKSDSKLPSNPNSFYSDFPGFAEFFGRPKRNDKYVTWQEASEVAIKLGIKDYNDYVKNCNKDPKLPAQLHEYYSDFPGFLVFLGKPKKIEKYLTWQEASEVAKKMNIKNYEEYKKNYKKDPKLPSNPFLYKDFPGMEKFLNKN